MSKVWVKQELIDGIFFFIFRSFRKSDGSLTACHLYSSVQFKFVMSFLKLSDSVELILLIRAYTPGHFRE